MVVCVGGKEVAEYLNKSLKPKVHGCKNVDQTCKADQKMSENSGVHVVVAFVDQKTNRSTKYSKVHQMKDTQ